MSGVRYAVSSNEVPGLNRSRGNLSGIVRNVDERADG